MKSAALVDIAAELLRDFRYTKAPADRALQQFLTRKKFLGSKERRFVGDCFFHALRHLMRIDEALRTSLENARYHEWLTWRTGFPASDPKMLRAWSELADSRTKESPIDHWFDSMRIALAAEDLNPGFMNEQAEKFFTTFPIRDFRFPEQRIRHIISRAAEVLHLLAAETKPIRFPIKHSFPEWIWGLIGYGLPPQELDAAASALNQAAPAALRVNTLKTTRDEYLQRLGAESIAARAGALASDGIVLEKRTAPRDLPDFHNGFAEFQDEGSQFITELLGVRPGMQVIDACAGAGGKTLQIAATMNNEGRIFAHDISERRLMNLRKRADSAAVTIAEIVQNRSDVTPADLVLIDAPCSGLGTLRRSPELRWRLTRETFQERLRAQKEILEQWAPHVKNGGILAYATCSIVHDENGAQVDAFLARHKDFERVPFTANDRVQRTMLTRSGDIQLYPHRHGADGFFLARLRRRS